MSGSIDELHLQRLVDGEMSATERCEVLASLDQQSGAWRDVALAFVEEQIWQHEVKSTQDIPVSTNERRFASTLSTRGKLPAAAWIALATTILIAFFVSFRLGEWNQARRTPDREPKANDAVDNFARNENGHGQKNDVTSNHPSATYRLRIVLDDGRVIELPAYEASELQHVSWNSAPDERVDSLNRRLVELGYRLEYETEYLSGQLEDGRELIVPIRNVAMRYHGQ